MQWLNITQWHGTSSGSMQHDERGYVIIYGGSEIVLDHGSEAYQAVDSFNHHTASPRIPQHIIDKNLGVNRFYFRVEDLENGNTCPRWFFHEYDGHYDEPVKKAEKTAAYLADYLAMEKFGVF